MPEVRTAVDRTFSGVSRDVAEMAGEDVLSVLGSGVLRVAERAGNFVASFSCQNQLIVDEYGYWEHCEDILFCVVDSVMSDSELFWGETNVGKGSL